MIHISCHKMGGEKGGPVLWGGQARVRKSQVAGGDWGIGNETVPVPVASLNSYTKKR